MARLCVARTSAGKRRLLVMSSLCGTVLVVCVGASAGPRPRMRVLFMHWITLTWPVRIGNALVPHARKLCMMTVKFHGTLSGLVLVEVTLPARSLTHPLLIDRVCPSWHAVSRVTLV